MSHMDLENVRIDIDSTTLISYIATSRPGEKEQSQ